MTGSPIGVRILSLKKKQNKTKQNWPFRQIFQRCWQRTNPLDFIFQRAPTKIGAFLAAAWQEYGLWVQVIIGCVTWVWVEERIGQMRRKGAVPLSLACSILSCAYIPLKCFFYRLRVNHIEHIFKCDRPAFLINKFFLFSLGKRLSRVQRMKQRMVGTELRHYLMWGQCCLYLWKNYSIYFPFGWGGGCSIGVFKTDVKT